MSKISLENVETYLKRTVSLYFVKPSGAPHLHGCKSRAGSRGAVKGRAAKAAAGKREARP